MSTELGERHTIDESQPMNEIPAVGTLHVPTLANPVGPVLTCVSATYSGPTFSAEIATGQGGLLACARIWAGIRGVDAALWLGLPMRDPDGAASIELVRAPGLGGAPYDRIALEIERTLSLGVSDASAYALLLLGAIALDGCSGGKQAIQLGRTACKLGAGMHQAGTLRTLYAMLIAPRAGELHRAVSVLAELCKSDAQPQLAALGLAGAGFAAGMALDELVRHLDLAVARPAKDRAQRDAAFELVGRVRMLRGLLMAHPSVPPSGSDDCGQEKRFGHWLTRLQAAWYAGEVALARQAAGRAAPLANSLTPPADLACYHLFAALAVARVPAALDAVRHHWTALNALAERSKATAVMAELVRALIDCRTGDKIAALRGFERATASATRRKQHWLASLAAEQAALQASEAGLATAAQHYRRLALGSCVQWGADGRAEVLCCAWGETMPARTAPAAPGAPAAWQRSGDCIELGASVEHEVNQPLTAIALHAAAARKYLSRSRPEVERAQASLSMIITAGRQVSDIVRSLRRLATHQDSEFLEVEVDGALDDVLLVLEHRLSRHGIVLGTAFGLGGCTIQANRVQVQQIATNLVLNAVEALVGAGPHSSTRQIQVSTFRCNEDMVEIIVADNGPGIALADRMRVFERLYSTKPGNTGMGLAISLAIARAHGGTLALDDCEQQGARFRLRLPVRPPDTPCTSTAT